MCACSTTVGRSIVLGAERVNRITPIVDQSVAIGTLGAVAVGILGTIRVDSQRGKDALACLEDIPGNAAETGSS